MDIIQQIECATPEPFELKVMKLALRGDADWIIGMREQLPHLTVKQRRETGVGFITVFYCDCTVYLVTILRAETGLPVRGYPPA
uniref:hypothetical protein n=1 Tax=Bordetella sputigena TaxID=1416810 RepID=UPI0039F1346F